MMKKKRKSEYKYSILVTWSESDGGWGIKVPELPGCFSFAPSLDEVPAMASQAMDSWISAAKKQGYEIPEPISLKDFSGKFIARIPPELHRNLALKAKQEGESLNRTVENLLSQALKG